MNRWLSLFLKISLSAILIGYLLQSVNLDNALSQLHQVSPVWLVISMLALAAQFIFSTVRWQVVLVALHASISLAEAFKLIIIGAFFNQLLPSSAGGDGVRIYKAYKNGLTLQSAINSVMLERLSTVLGLLLLVLICQPFFIDRTDGAVHPWMFPILALLAVLGTALVMGLDRFPTSWRRWRVIRGLTYLAKDTRAVFLHPKSAFLAILTGVMGNVNLSIGVWVLGLGLGLGEQFTFVDSLVLIPLVLLVTTLPISIAGWGVREASMVAAFGLIGVSQESALLVSVLLGLLTILISLPGALFLINQEIRTFKRFNAGHKKRGGK